MQYPIIVENLSKNYSKNEAVKNINFKISENESKTLFALKKNKFEVN